MRERRTVLIVHTAGLEGGGASTYVRGLAEGLLDCGCEVVLACFRHRGDEGAVSRLHGRGATVAALPPRALALAAPHPDFEDARLVAEMAPAEIADARDAVEVCLSEITARHLPDLIIASQFLVTAAAAVRVADGWRIPIAVVSYGADIELTAARSEPVRALARETFAGASVRVTLTHAAQCRLAELLDVSLDAMVQIPPGVCREFSHRVSFGQRPNQVAFVGRMSVEKGPHLLLAALVDALAEVPDLELAFVGDGPDREPLEALARALDAADELGVHRALSAMATTPERARLVAPVREALADDDRRFALAGKLASRVRFHGHVSTRAVAAVMAATRLVIAPSLVPECLPLALLEAMSSGAAIAAVPLGGAADLVAEVIDEFPDTSEFALIDPVHPVESVTHALIDGVRAWSPGLSGALSGYALARYRWSAIGERILSAVAASVAALTQPPRARLHQIGGADDDLDEPVIA